MINYSRFKEIFKSWIGGCLQEDSRDFAGFSSSSKDFLPGHLEASMSLSLGLGLEALLWASASMTWESGKVFCSYFYPKMSYFDMTINPLIFPPFPWNRFTILEKESMLGGTWFKNSYPGCECDVFAHFYSFSFCLVSFVDWKALLTFIPLRISTGARHIQGRQKSWATSILWRPSLGFFPT